MTELVSQWDRKRAIDGARQILEHFLYGVWDELREAQETITAEEIDAAIAAINKLSTKVSKAQQASHVWKGLLLDWKRHEVAAVAAAPTEPVPQAEPAHEPTDQAADAAEV